MNIHRYKALLFFYIPLFVFLLLQPVISVSHGLISGEDALVSPDDEIKAMHVFSPAEMQEMWKKFSADQNWEALNKDVVGKKFKRINHEKASWGFKGVMMKEKGMKEEVMFCTYDFYNPNEKSGQGCSMLWRKVGNEVYKAYVVFPPGVKETDKAFAGAQEWFAENGKVEKAHSFNKCFLACLKLGTHSVKIPSIGTVTAGCPTSCLAGVVVCTAAVTAIALATGGIGVPAALALFFGCAGLTCGQCLAVCALGCR